MGQLWDRAIVISAIRELHRVGEELNSGHIQVHRYTLYLAARKYCGGWRQAIAAAGYNYRNIRIKKRARPKWGKENVVAAIRTLHQAGERLNSNHVQLHHRDLYSAAVKYCKNWGSAVLAAGVSYDTIRVRKPFRTWSKGAIVCAIQARHRAGLPINGLAVSQQDRGLYHAARRHFGRRGYERALSLAGFSPKEQNPKLVWSKRRVIETVQQRYAAGKPLYQYFLCRNGLDGLVAAGKRYFRTWGRTIAAAGLNYADVRAVRMRWWNKRRVLAEIRRLARTGVRLNHRVMTRTRADLVGAAILHFGTWGLAVEAAGENYRQHSLTWSTKAWLRTLTSTRVKTLEKRALELASKRRRLT